MKACHVLAVLAPAWLSACGANYAERLRTYEGPELPPEQMVTLTLRSHAAGIEVLLVEVDGERMEVHEWQTLELTPGRHHFVLQAFSMEESRSVGRVDVGGENVALETRVVDGSAGASGTGSAFALELAAGRAYRLNAVLSGQVVVAQVLDVGANAELPSDSERAEQATPAPLAAAVAAPAPTDRPYVLVLGTAQDAGLPQIGCEAQHAQATRSDPERRRLVTALLLADPRSGERWLFEATPDIREQVARAAGHPSTRDLPGPRPPLFEGVFLTHAHMGHYTGLVQLGPEAYGARELPVHASARMAAFLRSNQPWGFLVEGGTLVLNELLPGQPVALAADLSVEALVVPHRDELSDTLAFVIRGPRRALLFLPDIDKWERWEERVEDVIAGVDVALVDGTFFAGGEVPGRDLSEIPHPFILESIARFAALPAEERDKLHFLHLNHTNPVCDPASQEAGTVRGAGMHVAGELQRFDL